MPEQIKVSDFLRETWDDYNSPTTSTFINRIGDCRNTVSHLEEIIDGDRSNLTKMKKTTKALFNTGNSHLMNEAYLAENLEKIGNTATNKEKLSDIGTAFLKFAVVTKELSALMKNLMAGLNNSILFPLDTVLKGELRGVKGDLRKPVDKAWKDYEAKFAKIEKEKKQLAKDAGMIKTEVTGAEIAEELEKERRIYQLQMTEYLIRVNEVKTRKGVDLLQHLVEYYHLQMNYFSDGLKTIEHFKCYIEELVNQLGNIKQKQDAERRDLVELRDALKSNMAAYNRESMAVSNQYNLHQLQGNKAHGYERIGYLLKKSEGKMRKVWQKRKCIVKDGILSISHSDMSKEPVKLNLLTCQVKLIYDDPGKKCFDLISSSKNRTYHFQAEDTQEMEAWISVLNNAKESVLMKAFGESSDKDSSPMNQSVKELTRTIIEEVKRLPGNRYCCDCGAPDPEWLSVNLGVLICLECCGVHRDMGVHISRTQSIVIDDLGTSQLLLARVVSNRGFNEIMEARLDIKYKPSAASDMEERKNFIRAKYERRRYAIITCTNIEDRKFDLKQAVGLKDIFALLQVYAEGIDFMEPLPDTLHHETALHLAVAEEDNRSLYMVDFIIQNTNMQFLSRTDCNGDNALHYCARLNKAECMKLLLRIQPDLVNCENAQGQTPLEVAREAGSDFCVELINHALSGKKEMFNNVNIDWGLVSDDHSYDDVDYSDDDLDKVQTPDRKPRSRPGSLVMNSDMSINMSSVIGSSIGSRDRAGTGDSSKSLTVSKEITGPSLHGDNRFNMKGKGLILPPNLSGSTQSLVTSTLQRKKAPAPPPPTYRELARHSRKHSDPGFGSFSHHHSSDPPPLPEKMNRQHSPNTRHLPGAKLVLPPPVEFRSPATENAAVQKPAVAPRPTREKQHKVSSQSLSDDYVALDSQTVKTDSSRKSSLVSGTQGSLEPQSLLLPGPSVAQNIKGDMPYTFTGYNFAFSMKDQGNVYNGKNKLTSGNGNNRISANSVMSDKTHQSVTGSTMDFRNSNVQLIDYNGQINTHARGHSTDSQDSSSSRDGVLSPQVLRCRAMYDCDADNDDELSFKEGEIIVIVREEEEEWWDGHIESDPSRKGMFPKTFVEMI